MQTIKPNFNKQRRLWISLLSAVVILAGCAQGVRHAEVARKGTEVMPFDLDKTTHIFEKTAQGGLQQVVADEVGATEQIGLIRMHLLAEAERFAAGDFSDPARIHGDQMPGLHELEMGSAQITVEYSERENGAQILYTTQSPELVEAIHNWFDAQLSDHGNHATGHQ